MDEVYVPGISELIHGLVDGGGAVLGGVVEIVNGVVGLVTAPLTHSLGAPE